MNVTKRRESGKGEGEGMDHMQIALAQMRPKGGNRKQSTAHVHIGGCLIPKAPEQGRYLNDVRIIFRILDSLPAFYRISLLSTCKCKFGQFLNPLPPRCRRHLSTGGPIKQYSFV